MKEDDLESLTLGWLQGIGDTCLTGEGVSLGGCEEARSKYTEVGLDPQLKSTTAQRNPRVPLEKQASASCEYSEMTATHLKTTIVEAEWRMFERKAGPGCFCHV